MKSYNRGILLDNGQKIYFDYGTFDEWCVYVEDDGCRYTPKDVEYFKDLYALGQAYTFDKVYNSFCRVYDGVRRCGWNIINRANCIGICTEVASQYSEHTQYLWVILFMTMLAEEMKAHTILGKRIKRLAIHKILLEQQPIEATAYGMVGRRWYKLDAEMQERGF